MKPGAPVTARVVSWGRACLRSALETFLLFLPVCVPSWRFFEKVAPSPRIELAWLETPRDTAAGWREFRPKPPHLPWHRMLARLFHNARGNETLFLVSCAERLVRGEENGARHLLARILADRKQAPANPPEKPYLQFRLTFVERRAGHLHRHVLYVSQPCRYPDTGA